MCILAEEVTAFLTRSASLPEMDGSGDGEFINVMDTGDRSKPFSDPKLLFVKIGGKET